MLLVILNVCKAGKKKKSTCLLHGCKGNRRQELHLPVPRKAKVQTDLLDICKNSVRAQLHPGEILPLSLSSFSYCFSQSLFFSIFLLLSKSLLFKNHSYTCASPHPDVFISDLLRSKSYGFSYFPTVQCFSCSLPLDCVFERAQGRYFGAEERKGAEWLETVSFNSQESKTVRQEDRIVRDEAAHLQSFLSQRRVCFL